MFKASLGLIAFLGTYFLPSPLSAEIRKLQPGAGPAAWTNDLSSIARSDWTYERAAHLLERAGFGGTPQEVDKLARMTPEQAVEYLVNYEGIENSHLPAFEESGIYDPAMLPDVDTHLNFVDALKKSYVAGEAYGVKPNHDGNRRLQPIVDVLYYRLFSNPAEWNRASIWWANRMLNTHRPLEEKLTLFWSGHFAVENGKVEDYRLMLDQNAMFRRHANGNFRTLLTEVTKDPAMLIYLDNRENVKGHANENYAREVMELFTLGVGNYTENDIKEAARALTGYTNSGRKFTFKPELHDDGEKTVLGEKGNFKAEDIIDILLRQKATAEWITRKLYVFFVREDLSPGTKTALATRLRANNYELKPFLKALLLSKDFYSPASYATQIKSPIQFQIATYRKLGMTTVPGTPYLVTVLGNLGQNLGNPPNVKGWDGGRAWINPSTLLIRGNTVRHLLFPEEAGDSYKRNVMPERYEKADKEAAERDKLLGQGGGANQMAESKPGPSGGGDMMMAPVSQMLAKAPDYDLKLGVYRGYLKTFERVKPSPPSNADLSLTGMAKSAQLVTSGDAVDYFIARFLRLPLESKDYQAVLAFATLTLGEGKIDYSSSKVERDLREVLHMILSTPEYQLS